MWLTSEVIHNMSCMYSSMYRYIAVGNGRSLMFYNIKKQSRLFQSTEFTDDGTMSYKKSIVKNEKCKPLV